MIMYILQYVNPSGGWRCGISDDQIQGAKRYRIKRSDGVIVGREGDYETVVASIRRLRDKENKSNAEE